MKLSTSLLSRVLRIIGMGVVAFVALILILSIFRVSIPLGFLQPKIEKAVSQALGRDFRMERVPRVVIGLTPAFKLEGCRIGNPSGWAESADPLARLDRFFVKLGLVPLLKKELRIDDLEITGLQLVPQQTADGGKNWVFKPTRADGEPVQEKPSAATPESGGGWDFVELRRLFIEDVGLESRGPAGEKLVRLAFESVKGSAKADEGLTLDLQGTFQEKPFDGKFRSASLAELLDDRRAWPYEFSGNLEGASVALRGTAGTVDLEEAGEHDFTINAPEMERLEPFTGPMPRFGSVHLDGKLRLTQRGFAMPELNGNLGETLLNGSLDIDTTGEKPRVEGRLDLGSLDVAIFKKPENAAADEGEKKTETVPKSEEGAVGEGQPGRLQQIRKAGVLPFVGEVRLTVAEALNSKVKVEGLDMGVQIEADVVTADVSVEFAEAPLRGDLEIRKHDREANPISLDLDLEAKDADIGELVMFYTNASGFKGKFDRLGYTIKGEGEDLPDAWSRKQVGLEVINAEMTYQGKEKAFEFKLNRGFIDGAWNRESRMEAEGGFLGETFRVKFNRLKPEKAAIAGKLPYMDLSGEAFGASFRMAGETRREETDPKLPLELEVSGESLSALHRWLGVPKEAELPYGMKGTILFENGWHLEIAEGSLGQTQLSGELGIKKSEDNSAVLAKLAVGTVDFRELKGLFGKKTEEEKPADEVETGGGFTLDTPLLPPGVHVDDADVELKIEKLVFEDSEVSEVSLVADVRDGWVETAPIAFTHNGKQFDGIGAFDFRNEQPEAGFELNVESVEIGSILESINVAKGSNAQAGMLGVRIHARGKTLREILVESDLDVTFSEALWTVRDANTGAKMAIAIDSGSIGGKRGESTVLAINGKLKETPLKLEIKTDGIDAMIRQDEQINLTLDVEIAGSKIEAAGRALLPLDRSDLNAELTWTGEKLSDLDKLIGVDLPPMGPVSVKGNLQVVAEGYALSGLDLVVGETDLNGDLSVNTTGDRPRLDATLNTGRFQIDDFAVEGWSPKKGSEDSTPTERVVAADRKVVGLASPKVLGSLDANISLKAGDVRSGKDTLGSGSLTARLQNGRLEVAPVSVAIPGGGFSASLSYHPRADEYDWSLPAKTDRFDYGVLARRKDPETDSAGFLNIDVDLSSTGAPMDDFVMAHASGHMRFEVCPEKMNAGIFDFWGANLFFALMPQIDENQGSKVNCIIGHMNIESGLMTPEALGIDTTRVRVISEGSIDFKKDNIDLLLVPRPKKPEFLRAGTKIMVKGTFDDFDIETGPMPILRTLARMTGSTILFPGNMLFQERIPEDGSDLCSCREK